MEVSIERANLRDQIYDILKKLIISGDIKPGEKVNEEDIAATLNVSRTPIRETLLRLEHDGIVEIAPRKGAFIVSISKKRIIDILKVREVMEGLVVRLASERMTGGLLLKLRDSLNRHEAIIHRADGEIRLLEAADLDAEFHAYLLEACDNELAKNVMDSINFNLQFIRLRTVVLPARPEKTYREHAKVMEAIEQRDPQLAEKLMREHIESVRIDAWKNLENIGEE